MPKDAQARTVTISESMTRLGGVDIFSHLISSRSCAVGSCQGWHTVVLLASLDNCDVHITIVLMANLRHNNTRAKCHAVFKSYSQQLYHKFPRNKIIPLNKIANKRSKYEIDFCKSKLAKNDTSQFHALYTFVRNSERMIVLSATRLF